MKILETDPILEGITERDLSRYLGMKQWRRDPAYPRQDLLVFNSPESITAMDGELITVAFPNRTGYRDFYRRISEVLETLGVIEQRNPKEIAREIVGLNLDRLQIRILGNLGAPGSIPLEYAARFVQGIKDLIVAAACTEDTPTPFYRKATGIGMRHLQHCQFGQTQRGSFIATIESPIPAPAQTANVQGQAAPFSRRVFIRILRGLVQLEQAILNGNLELPRESYQVGLNANMCEAILNTKPDQGEPQFEYQAIWSSAWPVPQGIPGVIRLERNSFDYLETTARALRNSDESVEREVFGEITGLTTSDYSDEEGSDEDPFEYVATIQFENNGRQQRARVPLSAADHRIACDAYRDSIPVRVNGTLERAGNRWRLMGPRNFRIADENP